MAITIDTITKNAMLEQIETRTKAGSTYTYPRWAYYEGSTLLASVDLSASEPFDPASSGEIVLNAVQDGTEWAALSITPVAAGTCDSIQLQNRDYVAITTLTGANMGMSETELTTSTPITFTAAPKWSI